MTYSNKSPKGFAGLLNLVSDIDDIDFTLLEPEEPPARQKTFAPEKPPARQKTTVAAAPKRNEQERPLSSYFSDESDESDNLNSSAKTFWTVFFIIVTSILIFQFETVAIFALVIFFFSGNYLASRHPVFFIYALVLFATLFITNNI